VRWFRRHSNTGDPQPLEHHEKAWVDGYEFGDEFEDLRSDPERAKVYSTELVRELRRGHPLHGREWIVVAKWTPQDEIVVRSGRDVAVVHLTYTRSPPERLPWPSTWFFRSAEEFEARFERP
jgi:hypothetical protein